MSQCDPSCPPYCPASPFERVIVYPHITGGTIVEWSLSPNFRDVGDYVFQLQFGRTADPDADDWADVGDPVTDTYTATDAVPRNYAMTQWTHYRVQLTTEQGTYLSAPQSALGALTRTDWVKWKNHVRMWKLKLKFGPGSSVGYILKRRLYGAPCSCLDPQTGEVTKPQSTECYGTGWEGGYFSPIGCIYGDLDLKMTRDTIEDSMRGMVNAVNVGAKFLAIPQLYEHDVFVEKRSDVRYDIRGIQYLVAQNGVPAVISAKLVPFPFDHVIYKFPITE